MLEQSITLPCGQTIKNRIFKSAMSESLGDRSGHPDHRLERLYGRWSNGGTGLLITGNVMIDRAALGEPDNIVVEDNRDLQGHKGWLSAAQANNTKLWMQINHPGKQAMPMINAKTYAPSAVGFSTSLKHMFAVPRAMTTPEIKQCIQRYAQTASLAHQAGYDGVQLHGAHGYLISQFLSPIHNQRSDQWGGSIENRMRFMQEICIAVRKNVGKEFALSIKLNSADFQRGGFEESDALTVVEWLSNFGMDLIEISGGTYEAPAMTGARQSTKEREAYFLDFCVTAKQHCVVPLAVTGGFRSASAMNAALESGAVDMVGLARPLALDPDLSNKLLSLPSHSIKVENPSTGSKDIDQAMMLAVTFYEEQLHRMAAGKDPKPTMSAWRSIAHSAMRLGTSGLRKRRSA